MNIESSTVQYIFHGFAGSVLMIYHLRPSSRHYGYDLSALVFLRVLLAVRKSNTFRCDGFVPDMALPHTQERSVQQGIIFDIP